MAHVRALSVVALLTVFAGCSASSTSPSSSESPPPASGPVIKPPPTGDPESPPPVDPTNDPNAAACTGQPGSLYALTAKKLTVGDDVPLCRFQGSVLMIVNVASHCGNTPQYTPLQALYAKYQAQGFYVLGFPCDQFGDQEFDNEKDISAFCTNEYKITFPMFSIGNVNAPNVQPVYTWLKSQPGYEADVKWNFEKFLVSRKGQIVKRIGAYDDPDTPDVITAIEAELAKPK